ncbi:PucR family transcriptional regulator [Actinocrispum wychmicini]|uniref:DNA-binding PucR family transcriptional regulator n=1 Tax=Actinocrispum wychmicini TaxID=1213861 RepID=A0A4R2KH49_9PSEU|nr:helix-turn-helix domain-containing protein [Actinocrispum wychmicini]TCO65765.1 DNA-binding PucR family transcriptional regulator [Actinocrispum wychmicini]
MTTVRGLVDRVGPTLLRTVLPGDRPVTDVVIAEGGRRTHVAEGDLVLGVAVTTPAKAAELVERTEGASAVLLKPPLAASPGVLSAARANGTAVVEVHNGAAWAQLVWLLRTVLDAAADDESGAEPGAAGLGDLFRLADAAAAVVDAPVTIEDANSRVLAYSARQDRTDPARISTIMGRRVPDDVLARFRSRGVFRELSRGRTTIFVPAQQDGTLPRLIVPIRMGGELLGSMWAVVPGPVADERAAAFADTAPVVALHLLRRRALADAERRRSAELVRTMLQGKGSVRLAAAELDLEDEPHRVVAIDVDSGDVLGAEGLRLALWERITAGVGRRLAVTELHGVLYAIVPDRAGWPALRDALWSESQALVGVGAPAEVVDLTESRAQAEEALGLVRARLIDGPVAVHDESWPVVALHRAAVATVPTGAADLGPIPLLRAHDEQVGTCYVDTLYEWLRHPGDPKAAARELRIHANTLRYRITKLVELTGLNLDDPDTRLALTVQLATGRWA